MKINLKLDLKDAAQMRALSVFAASLAGAASFEQGLEPTITILNETEPVVTFKGDPISKEDDIKKFVAELDEVKAEAEKPKRTRRSKAEMLAASEAETPEDVEDQGEEVQAEEADADEQEGEDVQAEEEVKAWNDPAKICIDDIRRAVAAKKAVHLQVMKFKLKTDFKANTVNDLDDKHYVEFYNFVNGL